MGGWMSPGQGNCPYVPARALAHSGRWADNPHVMNESTPRTEAAVAARPKGTLLMAILAPFGVLAVMASPLFIDAIRRAAGV